MPKPTPIKPRTPPNDRVADPSRPSRAAAKVARDWRRTLTRVVAMLTVLALAVAAASMTTWDAEGASRIMLAAIAAVLIILRGPRAGGPPALAVVLGAEGVAQVAHAAALFGVL